MFQSYPSRLFLQEPHCLVSPFRNTKIEICIAYLRAWRIRLLFVTRCKIKQASSFTTGYAERRCECLQYFCTSCIQQYCVLPRSKRFLRSLNRIQSIIAISSMNSDFRLVSRKLQAVSKKSELPPFFVLCYRLTPEANRSVSFYFSVIENLGLHYPVCPCCLVFLLTLCELSETVVSSKLCSS